MTEQDFQSKVAELMGEISTLPPAERRKLEKLADDARQRHERLRATVSSLQESLDYLRLSIKYLVFDLEATRRENSYLRKMLEETTGGVDAHIKLRSAARGPRRPAPDGATGRPTGRVKGHAARSKARDTVDSHAGRPA